MKNKNDLLAQLDYRALLAQGSKGKRFLYSPMRYVYGIFQREVAYRFLSYSPMVKANTFFDTSMNIQLPAGLDIYLLNTKSHDSEIRLCKFIVKNLNQGDQFVDVGAHFGFYSLFASHLVGSEGLVLSIEGSPNSYKILESNILDQTNIVGVQRALGSDDSTILFVEYPVQYSEYNSIAKEGQRINTALNPKITKVIQTSLSKLMSTHDIHPKIIKIDVEGGEYDVLKGGHDYLKTAKYGMIAMEYLISHDDSFSIYDRACQLMDKLKYQIHIIKIDGSLLQIPWDKVSENLRLRNLDSDNIVFYRRK